MGMPLFVEHVAPNSRAGRGGMIPGDLIVVICGTNVARFSHDMAKSEILRAGNELDFTLQRGTPSGRSPLEALHHIQAGGTVDNTPPSTPPMQYCASPLLNQIGAVRPSGSPQQPMAHTSSPRGSPMLTRLEQDPRTGVVEEPTCRLGGPVYKDIQPKTYQILKSQLPDEEPQEAGRGPASIFDRKRAERSQYLKAGGPTIQKAYGEGVHK